MVLLNVQFHPLVDLAANVPCIALSSHGDALRPFRVAVQFVATNGIVDLHRVLFPEVLGRWGAEMLAQRFVVDQAVQNLPGRR